MARLRSSKTTTLGPLEIERSVYRFRCERGRMLYLRRNGPRRRCYLVLAAHEQQHPSRGVCRRILELTIYPRRRGKTDGFIARPQFGPLALRLHLASGMIELMPSLETREGHGPVSALRRRLSLARS